jgi:hypothetical protein
MPKLSFENTFELLKMVGHTNSYACNHHPEGLSDSFVKVQLLLKARSTVNFMPC